MASDKARQRQAQAHDELEGIIRSQLIIMNKPVGPRLADTVADETALRGLAEAVYDSDKRLAELLRAFRIRSRNRGVQALANAILTLHQRAQAEVRV